MIVLLFFFILISTQCTKYTVDTTDLDEESLDTAAARDRIAFTSERDGNFDIYVMDADGRTQIRLTDNDFGDRDSCWSR